ncbi:GNAT family N-acetyltransferase [Marinilabilia rubra]
MVVVEEYSGKGIGQKILRTIEQDALKKGYQYVRLDSDSKNPKLCHYYEK